MDKLIAQQHTLLARISRTGENLRKLGKASITQGALETALTNLEAKWHKFLEQDQRIHDLATPDDASNDYFAHDFLSTVEEEFSAQRTYLRDQQLRIESSSSPSIDSLRPAVEARARASLPRIELPTFSGSYTAWTRFKDLFSSLVLNDPSWSDAEKFHYLSASLSGEALQLVERIPIASGNFSRAWDLLQHRYENRRLLVDAQFDILYATKPCRSSTSNELKRLLNSVCSVAAVLNSLDVIVDDSAHWMVQHIVRRLDEVTLKAWETSLGSCTDPPLLSTLLEFIETNARTAEAFEARQSQLHPTPRPSTRPTRSHLTTSADTDRTTCCLCRGQHLLCFCTSFREQSPEARLHTVTSLRRCLNCLGPHEVSACRSSKTCQRCLKRHHTMIHDAVVSGGQSAEVTSLHTANSSTPPTAVAVLLATAMVKVQSATGSTIARALIDPCSEVSFISESLAQQLRLPRTACHQAVIGAGAKVTATARGKVRVTLQARYPTDLSCAVEALVLPRLTTYRPRCQNFTPSWPHLSGLVLADPNATASTPIDLLLGADVYPSLLLDGTRGGGPRAPVAQETIFGWILSGPTTLGRSTGQPVSSHACTIDDLTALVQRFWEQEEVPAPVQPWSSADAACEQHFQATHSRQPDGRYVVRLCLKRPSSDLGETHSVARRVLLSTERRFQNNRPLQTAYRAFMEEYQRLGHMQLVPREDTRIERPHFYLPHHGVMKVTDASTKLRVVFNGSRTSSTGVSLNEQLNAGPKLQRDLTDILLRWRRHKVAFLADIEKMYRQILVHPDDWDLQRILWRDTPDQEIAVFHLITVTYGLTCAPFLALRTLQQLANDEGHRFPRGAAVLRESTYVDDILSGADNADDAERTQEELIGLCKAGGFTLKKWNANHPALLSSLPPDLQSETTTIPWRPEVGCSALGLKWHPSTDQLSVSVHLTPTPPSSMPATKRQVLSQIAKLFDPLGWLAPFVIRGKVFMQQLWQLHLGWDDPLPSTVATEWAELNSETGALKDIRIPRWLGVEQSTRSRQIHIFVDASERAYAAVAYLRTVDSLDAAKVTLIAAKTKTAPLKTVSVPRLELCAATLGARLLVHLRRELQMPIDAVHLWSDSTITLAWLRGEPSRWHTYVANRVSEVQTTAPGIHLHHVGSSDNPADCASRGLTPTQLADHPLWWHGPLWLTCPDGVWNIDPPNYSTDQEARISSTCLHGCTPTAPTLMERYSSLDRLLRITAWCLRWTNPRRPDSSSSTSLRPEELRRSEEQWIKVVQRDHYPDEIASILAQAPLPRSSRITSLAPVIDDHDLLRVGGRIAHSLLSPDEQHPIILPPGSPLTTMTIEQAHHRTLHGGVQLTLTYLRQKYWIPQGRREVKKCIAHCIRCLRYRAAASSQLMGNLPLHRVTPSRPFLHSGVDYAGPFRLKTTPGRGHKTTKGYVALFVCFSTRAVHLEVVSDYSTPAFLAAFRRFSSRRGLCSSITSDCGTTFVGADKELRRMFAAASTHTKAIAHQLSKDRVSWKFIPPGAPHFGGLWEAGVRSVKHHIRRVIGDDALTFEEFSTFLCQVEACLNSRPLQALSDDPEDLAPLTPGHFLIGGPVLAVPEDTLIDASTSRLSRWQKVQQRSEHFWRRWSAEYLHGLQPRGKWTTPQPSLSTGDLVLIRSELTPPSRWPLARVLDVHPGSDGHVRVVTVKTSATTLKRPITKLVRLSRSTEQ